MKSAYAVVAVVVVAVACVTTNAAVMNKGLVHPSISADSVVLYRTPQEVPRPYDEVAILNSKGDADLTDESAMYNSTRKKAAQLGANGGDHREHQGSGYRGESRQGIAGDERQPEG